MPVPAFVSLTVLASAAIHGSDVRHLDVKRFFNGLGDVVLVSFTGDFKSVNIALKMTRVLFSDQGPLNDAQSVS